MPSISGVILFTLSIFSLNLNVDKNLTVCCQKLADLYTYLMGLPLQDKHK